MNSKSCCEACPLLSKNILVTIREEVCIGLICHWKIIWLQGQVEIEVWKQRYGSEK